jgi:Zn-dependent peptidase ImmA (M78 family)
MQDRKVMILGTEYTIQFVDSETYKHESGDNLLKIENAEGLTLENEPLIIIADNLPKHDLKHVLKHEIIHAFKHESGMVRYDFTDEEQQVDWIARQFSKINKVYKELKIL